MRPAAPLLAAVLLLTACMTIPAREEMASPHRERARALERDGQLRAALIEWKIARTIEPDAAEARAEQTRLEARIQRRTSERLAEARASLARGAHLEGRRKLLAVLALDPDNTTAAALLRSAVRDVDFVLHTVRSGETLGLLAERYYGDRSRGEVIWETNRLGAGKPLVVGSTVKIPEIPGLPFMAPGAAAPAPSAPVVTLPSPPSRTAAERQTSERTEEPPEINPMLADIRDAVDRKDYVAALADVDKYVALNPTDRDGLDLKKLALYRHASALIDQKSYDEGYKTLIQLARLQPDYMDVTRLVQQARRQVIDHHYQEGIRHFREERLEEAIGRWRTVLDMEPQHVNARRNIEQAERLLQALERRKAR
jgi:tetratricopeptide (TPR) repeat protein